MNIQLLIQLLINGLVVGTLYGVVAMSFVLIYKASQVVNFAQGELLLIGAWVCWTLLTKYQVPFYLGMPITLVFMFLFGIAIQIVILRPMIGEPIISVIMVTIALSTVFSALMKWMFGVNLQPFPRVFTTQNVNILGLQIQTVYLMSLAVSLAMMAGMAWFFRLSKYGLAMRATAFNQQVAQSLGISVKSVFAMAWAISATVSAVAGVVVAVVNGVSAGLSAYGIKVFPAAILGGLDSVGGAVLGGIIIGLLENFAQGELLLIGAWVCWALLAKYQVPFWLGMPMTLVFMFVFGIAIQILILRPMIGEPIISVIMVTIGLSTVFQAALKWIFGVNPQPFPRVFTSQSVSLFGLQIQTVYVMSLVVSVAMMIGMAWFFRASKYGLAMRATAFNQQVAQSLGISVKSVFAMAWAISATVSAVAGVVVAVVNGVSAGLSAYGIKVFPAAILGGLDSIGGAVLGGIIVGLLENFAHFLDSEYLHWGNLYEIAPFYALIVILMIKPYGLFGTEDIERV